MNSFDNYDNNYDDDTDYLVSRQRGQKERWFKFSLLSNILLVVAVITMVVLFTVKSPNPESSAQGGAPADVYGVKFGLGEDSDDTVELVNSKIFAHFFLNLSLFYILLLFFMNQFVVSVVNVETDVR